jgi:hypothetical protein
LLLLGAGLSPKPTPAKECNVLPFRAHAAILVEAVTKQIRDHTVRQVLGRYQVKLKRNSLVYRKKKEKTPFSVIHVKFEHLFFHVIIVQEIFHIR